MCIENTYGKAVYKAQVVPIVKKGVVAATHAWWFPEEEGEAPNLYGVYKSNINQLIPNNVNGPTGFGTNYKSVLCKVYKVPDRHYLAEQNYPEKLNKVWEERL
jgi:anaerobic selenocysteine-containing dehydrogenase